MIVCVLSLGSLWQEPKDGRPVIWNSTAVVDQRGRRPRWRIAGQIRIAMRPLQEALGANGVRGSLWHGATVTTFCGIRKLQLERRAVRGLRPDCYIVSVTEQLIGTLGERSWEQPSITLVSLSEWRSRQEALLVVRPHAWLCGESGSAVFTPDGRHGDWIVNRW